MAESRPVARSGRTLVPEQMCEPGAPEVIARRLGNITVLSEHHAPRQRRAIGREGSSNPSLSAAPHPLDEPSDPAAAASHSQRLDPNLASDPPAPEEPGEVETVA